MTEPQRTRSWATATTAAGAVFALALVYYALFVRFGLNLDDEGTLVHQFARMASGQRPYEDFHAGYTPGVYLVHSFLQGMFAQSLIPGRICVAVVNATTAALVTALLTPLAGVATAILGGLLCVALIPVYPSQFALFNIPYPGWYTVAAFVAGLLPARRFLLSPSLAAAAAAGAAAAVAFCFKPNVGAFQLACSMLLVLSALPRQRSPSVPASSVAWWWLVWSAVTVCVFAVFGFHPHVEEATSLLLPALACMLLTVKLAASVPEAEPRAGVIASTSAVVAGFAVVTAAWLLPFAMRLPLRVLLERVLFVGTDFTSYFYQPHPAVLVPVLALVALYGAETLLGVRLLESGKRPALPAVLTATVVVVAGGAWVLLRPMIEGFASAVESGFQARACYVAAVAAHWLLLAFAWQDADARSPGTASRSWLVLTFGAVFLYLQIYPRTDYAHWIWAAPLSIAGAVALVHRLVTLWRRASAPATGPLIAAVASIPALVLIGLGAARAFSALADFEGSSLIVPAKVDLGLSRAPVWSRMGSASRFHDLEAVVRVLDRAASPNDMLFGFPALDILPFLSGHATPLPDSYFFPGWLGHDDEAVAVAAVERERPRWAVVSRETRTYFEAAPASFLQFGAVIERDYRHYATAGRYEVLVRRDAGLEAVDSADTSRPAAAPAPADAGQVSAYVRAKVDGDAAHKLAGLDVLASDLLEGYHPEITALLDDGDARVRSAALKALRAAGDDETARDLAKAALAGRFDGGDRDLALRLAGAWAGPRTTTVFLGEVDAGDAAVREAARTALGNAAERRFVESFWFAREDASPALSLDDAARTTARSWLLDRGADERLKAFASIFVGQTGGTADVLGLVASGCSKEDLAAARVPERCVESAKSRLVAVAPTPRLQLLLLRGLADADPATLSGASLGVAGALAFDAAAADDVYGPAVALRYLRRDPAAADVIAARLAAGSSPAERDTWTYLASVLATARGEKR